MFVSGFHDEMCKQIVICVAQHFFVVVDRKKVYTVGMKLQRLYLGTWLPRTSVHLFEVYNFLSHGIGEGLEQRELNRLLKQLTVDNVSYNNNVDFDTVTYTSGSIKITLTEDGVILLSIDLLRDLAKQVAIIERYYIKKLAPAFSYLFSRGAPLPQTLLHMHEAYPRIIVGNNVLNSDAQKILKRVNDELVFDFTHDGLHLYYGNQSEIITIATESNNTLVEKFVPELVENMMFVRAFSDLLSRYVVLHRRTWSAISEIRDNDALCYADLGMIRNTIVDTQKTCSFIRVRLSQMNEILSARHAVASPETKKKLFGLGISRFETLTSSCQYTENLWRMTNEYANSSLTLFESLNVENTQHELRLLQQITVLGMLVGFFGMNIAFPWEDRWSSISMSSFVVVGILIISVVLFKFLVTKTIMHRKIPSRKIVQN